MGESRIRGESETLPHLRGEFETLPQKRGELFNMKEL